MAFIEPVKPVCFSLRWKQNSARKERRIGSANGNRTRISALKGPRANRCTIAPRGYHKDEPRLSEITPRFARTFLAPEPLRLTDARRRLALAGIENALRTNARITHCGPQSHVD